MTFQDAVKVGTAFGIGGTTIGCLVFWICMIRPETPSRVFGFLARMLSGFSSFWRKQAVSADIRAGVLEVSRSISKDVPGMLPYDLKVEWVTENDRESFIESNQVVVRMSNSRNPQKNMVYAMQQYIAKGLIPLSRNYVEPKLLKATDMTVVHKALAQVSCESVPYYLETVMMPEMNADPELREMMDQLSRIDNSGMLLPVLINELAKIGQRLFPQRPSHLMLLETKAFMRFLFELADRHRGDVAPRLRFDGAFFKVAIGYAISAETLKAVGLRYHMQNIETSLSSGIRTIYIFGWERHMDTAKLIADEAARLHACIKLKKVYHYTHVFQNQRTAQGICVRLDTEGDAPPTAARENEVTPGTGITISG